MFGNPVFAARGQRDGRDPAHVCQRRVGPIDPAIGPRAKELVLEIIEQRPGGRRVERRLILEKR